MRELVADSGFALASLDAIAVVHGPGSFTGVRVGLSAAKGLCEALQVPLIALSRLAVLASLAKPVCTAEPGEGVRVRAVLDAGRGEFYSGIYADGLCECEALLTREELFAEELVEESSIIAVCEGMVAESLGEVAPQLVAEPMAEMALRLAIARYEAKSFDDVATIDANYLRRTDAEIFARSASVSVQISQRESKLAKQAGDGAR
jgi:tRNA threonylcarbamoyladenosine biosynthesis protein TsaB